MPQTFNKNTFATTYKDDWVDSANYHRILFNSGRALQARELTQLQTITQAEISRLGRHIFNQGAAVNPGSVSINNNYEFVKLQDSTLPAGTWVGRTLTSGTTSIQMKVLEAVDATDTDPATLYVRYTSTTGGASGTTPVRVSSGETLTGGPATVTVQTTDTIANPCTGLGTKVSIAQGDFFAIDRFVFAKAQSFILSKYTSKPNATIGFKVTEDIVTTADTFDLFDNQGTSPNTSAPGADRYRIKLEIADEADLDSDENFVYVAKIIDGAVATQVTGVEEYNKISDILAIRTQEESGNYIAKRFELGFETNDTDATKLDFKISRGVAYVDGYRSVVDAPTEIAVDKPRATIDLPNSVVSVDYGTFLEVSGNRSLPNISLFEKLDLRDAVAYGGSTIGTARVRAIVEDGASYKLYLFDVLMNDGKNRQNTRSVGTSATSYFDVTLDNSQAAFRQTANDDLLYKVPNDRPKAISDISLTVQRRESILLDSSGEGTLSNLSAAGETFADQDLWIASSDSADAYAPTIVSGGAGGTAAQIGGGPNNINVDVAYYVNKAQAQVRNKVLTETTETLTPNADGDLELNYPDIYEVLRVTDVDSDGASVSSRYILDNGQRDTHYQRGKMTKKAGQTTPSGDVFVRYKYFSHQAGGDFFAVNSYTGQVAYNDIPKYTSTSNTTYELRNVLDFRSSVNPGSTFPGDYSAGARINELPRDADTTQFDVSYYMGKNARVIIDRFNNVSVIESEPDLNPQFPPVPANSMELYRVEMNPFTIHDSDLSKERIPAKRYTMADIGKLESRIDNIEEVTALNLLELETETFAVLDSSNNSRLKAGFLVDNFADQSRSFVEDLSYQAGIDLVDKVVRPWQAQNSISLKYDSDKSTNTILKGDNVYKKYTHVTHIEQAFATETENINPFAVIINEGMLELSPTNDSWIERKYLADKDNPQQTRVIPSTSSRPLLFNDFVFNWTGQQVNLRMGQTVASRTTTGGNTITTQTDRVIGDRSDRIMVRDHLIDQVFIPYMRSRKVYFRCFGLKPATQVYAFFNNKPVADWVRSETFQRIATNDSDYGNEHARATAHPAGSSTLTTDAEGYVSGSFFIPSTAVNRFKTGTQEFKLLDISIPNDENSTSIAKAPFTSTGILETRQREFNNTRVVTIGGQTVNRRRQQNFDPLAQTFTIDDEEGIFVTKVGIRFKTKDTAIPVMLQLRPVVNGIPSADDIIPGAVKVLSPSSIAVSDDASAVTYFEFDEPIYLNGLTEYSMVLLADTTEYNVYVARAGDLQLNSTEARVAKQPSLGSLFLSQNARTWTPDQERDLTFEIQRADFSTADAYVVLENRELPKFIINTDGLLTTNADSDVQVDALGHGLRVGDKVSVSAGETVGGILAADINGDRDIIEADGYGFKFRANTAATSSVFGGGENTAIIPNYMADAVYPIIEELVPPKTLVTHQGKFLSGNSWAGAETTYGKDANWIPMTNNALVGFEFPKMVANRANEAANLAAGERSATYRIKLINQTSKVSPLIDTQRTNLILTHNMVDKQATVAATGVNVPLNYVAETNAQSGSGLSKHITIPVTLAEEAVGLKVILAANRPNVADFDLYVRTNGDAASDNLFEVPWRLVPSETSVPSDDNPAVFREYRYLDGGKGGDLDAFNQFQVKIVFKTTNSAKVPVIKDLRVIAMAT